VVLTVLNSFSRQSFLVSTNVSSALEVFLNDMHYINSRFTYLLTYLLTYTQAVEHFCFHQGHITKYMLWSYYLIGSVLFQYFIFNLAEPCCLAPL